MRVDLHLHTTASDGSWTPEQLMGQIVKAGIELFAVTDHDTVANVQSMQRLAQAAGIAFIPGVEISTTHNDRSFHILGYGIDPEHKSLQELLHTNMTMMEELDHDSIRKLIQQGLPISYQDYVNYQNEPSRGGWKSLNFLIDQGLCDGVHDFFARLFTAERGISFPVFSEPAVVIDVISKAGGVAILAHPGSEFHGASLTETLEFFLDQDIHGIECFHPGHNAADTQLALDWCEKYNRLITGGSDCHGEFVGSRQLGQPMIELAQLRLGLLENFIPKRSFGF